MTSNDASRESLLAAILNFLPGQDADTRRQIKVVLEREIEAAGAEALLALRSRLLAEADWAYYPPDPLVRRIHHLLAERFLSADSVIEGVAVLDRLAGEPVVIVSNHLSYADANVIETLLARAGADAFAARLTALAGPKIFSDKQRRFSSLCFGTIKVPQSSDVSSGEAVLNPRDVARAARQSIDVARARLAAGDALLLFGEGTRSRTGEMQPMLPAAARYLEMPGTWVLPVGLVGPDDLYPVGDATLRPARVELRLGAPFRGDTLLASAGDDRRLAMDAVGLAVAELLPEERRGVYRAPDDLAAARALLERLRTGDVDGPMHETASAKLWSSPS
ncbi:MAG: lysophospholipid acyltransferase family protein [Vicinamibacterales bacterium]